MAPWGLLKKPMEKHKHKYHKCHQITEWFVLERSFKDHLVQTLNVFFPMFSALIQELQCGIERKEGEALFLVRIPLEK